MAEWKVRTRSSTRARSARNSGSRLVDRSRSSPSGTGEVGHDPAGVAAEHDDPLAEEDRLLDVVGDHDHGDAGVGPDLADEDLHVLLGLHVQRAERLVEQQHLGLAGQRPGDRDPLPLAAGELLGQGLAQCGQPGLGQVPVDPRGALGPGQPGQQFQPERDVALDRPQRIDGTLLEDEAAVRARRR